MSKDGLIIWDLRTYIICNLLIEGINVREFAKNNNLPYSDMVAVLNGRKTSCRGWRKAP